MVHPLTHSLERTSFRSLSLLQDIERVFQGWLFPAENLGYHLHALELLRSQVDGAVIRGARICRMQSEHPRARITRH